MNPGGSPVERTWMIPFFAGQRQIWTSALSCWSRVSTSLWRLTWRKRWFVSRMLASCVYLCISLRLNHLALCADGSDDCDDDAVMHCIVKMLRWMSLLLVWCLFNVKDMWFSCTVPPPPLGGAGGFMFFYHTIDVYQSWYVACGRAVIT